MDNESDLHDDDRRVQGDDDEGIPNVILFVFCFFTIWNMIICVHTVKACSGVVRGEFNESAPSLFCPHWIVGIAIPMYVGYSWYGLGGLFFCTIPFIVPHAIGIFWLKYRERQSRPPGPAAEGTGVQPDNSLSQTGEGDSAHLRNMTELERLEYLDKILITKKVVTGHSLEIISSDQKASFRSRNPKDDIALAPEKTEQSISDQVFSSVSKGQQDEDEKSAKICSICLEEYQVDEEICWSKNPECSHVYHKKCLVDWLLTDTSCPNCRQSYVGDFTQNEPEP